MQTTVTKRGIDLAYRVRLDYNEHTDLLKIDGDCTLTTLYSLVELAYLELQVKMRHEEEKEAGAPHE